MHPNNTKETRRDPYRKNSKINSKPMCYINLQVPVSPRIVPLHFFHLTKKCRQRFRTPRLPSPSPLSSMALSNRSHCQTTSANGISPTFFPHYLLSLTRDFQGDSDVLPSVRPIQSPYPHTVELISCHPKGLHLCLPNCDPCLQRRAPGL